jgi:YidC/Oxa1 family membrane protein insertase
VTTQQKDKFTPELRILVASVLSMAIMLVWIKYFGPKPPVNQPQPKRAAIAAPAQTPAEATKPDSHAANSATPTVTNNAPVAVPTSAKGDTQERTIVVESDLYRVELSNRGGIVKSWQLKKYTDDAKPPRILDVVHPQASQQINGWPFAVVLDDEQLQNAANAGLYQISSKPNEVAPTKDVVAPKEVVAPTDITFSWSDGHLEIAKHFHFDPSYTARVDVAAKLDGKPITAGVAWLGGFGDLTVANPANWDSVQTYYSEGGKISTYLPKKLDGIDKWGNGIWQGGKDFTGLEDRYFTAAFLPASGAAPGTLETRYWKTSETTQVAGQETQVPVSEVATAMAGSSTSLRVFVGPKDYDDLKKMNPPLHGLVNFGWMEFIADPLFHALKWLHAYIPNWGWAIVVLTLIINMLLFPLRISSYRTTLKMQRVGPEIKSIQDKYKKYTMRDPRKAEMNKEVMAVYQREGINPVGGCFQMFLQMPIWFGLNTALRYAIEMRHARWFGWITDLSARDPYYILPAAMGLSMYLVSKMTPMTSTDPQQQMMMKIMPVTMAGIFMISPISSGLAVYILTSSVVGIGQQWYLNRTHPAPPPAKIVRNKKS